jgi:hypothetical protein
MLQKKKLKNNRISFIKRKLLSPMFIEDVKLQPKSYMQMSRKNHKLAMFWREANFGGKQTLAGKINLAGIIQFCKVSRFPWDPPRGARAE